MKNTISVRISQKGFSKISDEKLEFVDAPKFKHPDTLDSESLLELMEIESNLKIDKITERINSSRSTIRKHLKY